jgi:hypothetical protein
MPLPRRALRSWAPGGLTLSLLLLAAFALGVYSSRHDSVASRIARAALVRAQRLFSSPRLEETGLWHKGRDAAAGTPHSPAERQALANLQALPYLQGYAKAPARANVTIHDEKRAQDGLNFVVSADAPRAFLMDMKGKVLHTWRKSFEETWPPRAPGNARPRTSTRAIGGARIFCPTASCWRSS